MFVATTEFSLGHSLLSCDDVIKISNDNGLDTVVVTDTMSITSMIPLADKLKERLVIGVRISVVDECVQERKPIFQPKVYPVNEDGMKLLYQFLSKSYERPYFYEQPRLGLTDLIAMLNEGHGSFILSTGDINSILKHPNAESIVQSLREAVPEGHFVFDICPVPTALHDRLCYDALRLYQVGDKVNLYVPALYKKEDADVYPIHYSISKNVEFNFLKPWHQEFYYEPGKEKRLLGETLKRIKERYGYTPTIKLSQVKFPERYTWTPQPPRLPTLSSKPMDTLKRLAIDGLKQRAAKSIYGYKPDMETVRNVYVPRLKYEFDVIEKLGFANYFLMVYELTDWCTKQGIKIGPGRGSVGGSLIAFCMGITDVDPLRFDLMFERFINPTRIDLPDIDLDFMSTRRHEIVEHLIDRYGNDNVAGIINYAKLGSKSALRSTCRILGMADTEYACSKLIPSQFGFNATLSESLEKVIDIKNFSIKYPDVWSKALKLESKLRNYGTHAAGIIVSDRPLVKDAVIQVSKGTRVCNWDKKLCEKQGLIKLDVLGLTTLDIIDLALDFIQKRHGTTIDLHEIPLNDPRILHAFAIGNTGGVFQFEGGSVRKLLKDLSKYEELTFDDLVAATALNRPGPIEAGLVQMYVDGKNGNLHDVDHESMKDALAPTYNVMVYQEQVMKVAVEFAGYTLPEADNLRKIMGKKLPEEMKKEAEKFITGAITHVGSSRELATHVFDQISKFAFYAFNKSHSVEYSLLAYLCMWLKMNYPVEYYAASLTYVDDKKVRTIINEARKQGIKVLAPDINRSGDKFNPVGTDTIVSPLNKVKYVNAAANSIVLERETNGDFVSLSDLQSRVPKRLVNSRVIDSLKAVGALDSIEPPSAPVCPVERSKALNEYLPSIPLGHVHIARSMEPTPEDKQALVKLLERITEDDDSIVKPYLGKDAKFMVVYDYAAPSEVKSGTFTETKAFTSVNVALYRSGLTKADGYFTGLVKRGKNKGEKVFSNEVLEESFKILLEEIEILKPTAIVCLGTQIAKMFDGAIKGGASDNAGKVLYRSDLDANVIFSINPSTLFFNPDLEPLLTETFEIVESML